MLPAWGGVWLLVLATAPLHAYLLATLRGRASTRTTSTDLFRLVTGVVFCGWVDLTLGLLAASAALWQVSFGPNAWTRQAGATLWPLVAMGVVLARDLPLSLLDAALAIVLAVGVMQSGVSVLQMFRVQILPAPWPHGTLGHRVCLGVYLAMVTPLGFLTDYGWPLAAVYMLGLLASRSGIAALAVLVALSWVDPSRWYVSVGLGLVGLVWRGIEWSGGHVHLTNVRQQWAPRRRIWTEATRRLRRWPHWLIGFGAGAMHEHARRWIEPTQREVFQEAHNDYLETFYDYGLIGCLAIGWWLWRVSAGLAIGDPLTGSLLALGVGMATHFPLKVGTLATAGLLVALTLTRRVA